MNGWRSMHSKFSKYLSYCKILIYLKFFLFIVSYNTLRVFDSFENIEIFIREISVFHT